MTANVQKKKKKSPVFFFHSNKKTWKRNDEIKMEE